MRRRADPVTTETPPLRRQEPGEVPCAACGVACPEPVPDREDERGQKYHSTYGNGRTKLLVQLPSVTTFNALPVIMSRCAECLTRYDAWLSWGEYNAGRLGLGSTATLAERLGCVLHLSGYDGPPSPALIASANLTPRCGGDHRSMVRWCDPGRPQRGAVATRGWSWLSDQDEADLLMMRAEVLDASMTDTPTGPTVLPCPAPEAVPGAQPVAGGCLCCGIASITFDPATIKKPRRVDFHHPEPAEPDVPRWKAKTLSARALAGRPHGGQASGHLCHRCNRLLVDGTAAVGQSLIDEALRREIDLPAHHSLTTIKTYAARVLDARRAGRPEPTGETHPFGWLRTATGALPRLDIKAPPPEPERSVADVVAEQMADAEARVEARLRAEFAEKLKAATAPPKTATKQAPARRVALGKSPAEQGNAPTAQQQLADVRARETERRSRMPWRR